MPVIPTISQGILTGLKYTPGAPPQLVGAIKSAAQASMSSTGLMPMVPPIPVIPVGVAVSATLTVLEAMLNLGFEQASKLASKLIAQYNKDLTSALETRAAALDELYESETTKQSELQEEVDILQEEITVLQEEIEQLTQQRETEMSAYQAVIFEYKEKAKKAEEKGDAEERDYWIDQVSLHDEWLAEIILIVIEITNKNIEVISKERDIENKQELLELNIQKEWEWLEEHATDFEVAVPFYPDVPTPPTIPDVGAIPKESPLSLFTRQIFAKWIATPTVPPIGLVVSAIQMVVQSFSPVTPAQAAAQIESIGDSLILYCGGIV